MLPPTLDTFLQSGWQCQSINGINPDNETLHAKSFSSWNQFKILCWSVIAVISTIQILCCSIVVFFSLNGQKEICTQKKLQETHC